MTLPTELEVDEAFEAGFASIDEGFTFYNGFDALLITLGYRFDEKSQCACSDRGEHGHLPECRWVKAPAGQSSV